MIRINAAIKYLTALAPNLFDMVKVRAYKTVNQTIP